MLEGHTWRAAALWAVLFPASVLVAGPAAAQYLVVFEASAPAASDWAGDIDIGAQGISAAGEVIWNPQVFTAVASGSHLEQRPVAVSDGAGGAIVIMQAAAREGEYAGDWEIIAQRVDASGKLLWEAGERSVVVAASNWRERSPVAISDGAGGALVFWEAEGPPGSEWAGDIDIIGQRLSPTGELLWGQEGVPVASGTNVERAPCAISDGAGGALVFFEGVQEAGNWGIAGQRVSPDGELLWLGGQASIFVAASNWDETRPVAVPDGEHGALVFFEAAAPAGGEHAGDVDIHGQRVSMIGNPLWGEGHGSVLVHGSDAIEQAPAAVSDGAGGAIVLCQGATREGELAGDWQILGHRISGDGQLLWNEGNTPALVAATEMNERAPCALADGAGGAFVVFEAQIRPGTDRGGDIDLYAQRLSAAGASLWTEEGSALAVSCGDYAEQAPCIAPDGEGGVVVVFEAVARAGEYAGDYEIAGQRIGPDGSVLWNNGERASIISATAWSERWPVLPDGAASGARRAEAGEAPATPAGPARPTTPGVNPANPTGPRG